MFDPLKTATPDSTSCVWTLGKSVQGREIRAVAISNREATVPLSLQEAGSTGLPWILVLGGVHADEVEGIWISQHMTAQWQKRFLYKKFNVLICSLVNPDGFAAGTRQNAHSVDLNRNMPTLDWDPVPRNPRYNPGPESGSEPETKILVELIDRLNPKAILSAHSFSTVQVNANGPSHGWATELSRVCGYPVTEDIGYPTPGSLGTYAGAERRIPTITLELERGMTKDRVLALHEPTFVAALDYWETREK